MLTVLFAAAAIGLADAARPQTPEAVPAAPAETDPLASFNQAGLPYGLPAFDRIKDGDFVPAIEAAMAEQRAQVEAIASNLEPATFGNTLVAMERSGVALDRVTRVFSNLNATNTNPEIERIDTQMAPRLAAHQDAIELNPALFARIETVFARRGELDLDPESMQLLQRYHTQFVRAGARLAEPDKARLRQFNERLAELSTHFQQNVRKASNDGAVVVDDAGALDGLSAEQIGAAARAARARGLEGKWLIALQNTTIQPMLAHMNNRALRERVYRASVARGNGGSNDNTAVVAEMIRLRAQRARLLGYPTHAAYALEAEGAATPEAVNKMIAALAGAAAQNARREASQLQGVIDSQARAAHVPGFKLQAWDWAYYERIARKRRFDFDDGDVKPYFEMDRVVRDGVFFAAHELYGVTFKERADLPRYHPDVRVYEVFDADGSPLALLMTDLYARESKRGGAWMNAFVHQSRLLDTRPVVKINLNVAKPADGMPTLLTFDETTTLFHEFGHALHAMFSNVNYPLLAGTKTPRDFVEYPSQFNEMWGREPAVMAHFARHYETGEPLPPALFDKVLAARRFGQGYATAEYLTAAALDQAWHQIGPDQAPAARDVMPFERTALQRVQLDLPQVPPRYHTPYFLHAFVHGYEAAYYAYIWSEVLARDTEQWFHLHGGLNRANGDFFRAKVLSRGRSEEPAALFAKFYGGPPQIGPLLEHRGLVMPKPAG